MASRMATGRSKQARYPVGTRLPDKDGYIYIKLKNDPLYGTGWVRENILVAARSIRRRLEYPEVAHHKNEDKGDNDPENIEILTDSEHASHHILQRGPWNRGLRLQGRQLEVAQEQARKLSASEEVRKKISAAARKRFESGYRIPINKDLLSKRSKETWEKRRSDGTDRNGPLSDEHREKIRAGRLAYWEKVRSGEIPGPKRRRG